MLQKDNDIILASGPDREVIIRQVFIPIKASILPSFSHVAGTRCLNDLLHNKLWAKTGTLQSDESTTDKEILRTACLLHNKQSSGLVMRVSACLEEKGEVTSHVRSSPKPSVIMLTTYGTAEQRRRSLVKEQTRKQRYEQERYWFDRWDNFFLSSLLFGL